MTIYSPIDLRVISAASGAVALGAVNIIMNNMAAAAASGNYHYSFIFSTGIATPTIVDYVEQTLNNLGFNYVVRTSGSFITGDISW